MNTAQRKFLTGKKARLNKDIKANSTGVAGQAVYGSYGQEIQIMSFDPSKDKPYGIRKPGENFPRTFVAEEDLMPFDNYEAPAEIGLL